MWSIIYLGLLKRAYLDFLRLREYCDEQITNHYDVYKIVENYGKYGIPFENLNHTELEATARDIMLMYQILRSNVIADFKEFYLKHEDGYKEGLHLYLF